MREEAERAGRDPDAIEVSVGGYPGVDDVKRFEEVGAYRVVVPSFLYRQFAEDVIAKLRVRTNQLSRWCGRWLTFHNGRDMQYLRVRAGQGLPLLR